MSKRFSPLAVIVTYNPEFSKTIQNVKNLNANKIPVLVVDNHSKNVEEIRSKTKKPNVLLKNPNNEGLGIALNKGIEYAKSNGFSHVWLFDQDSLLQSDAILVFLAKVKGFQKTSLNIEKVGSYGPSIFDSIKNINIYGLADNENGILNAPFLITSGSFYSVDVFEGVGLINTNFFIDYLDYEWCFRANSFGYVHKIVAEAKMNHSIGNESKNILGIFKVAIHSPFRWYFLFRNGILMCAMSHVPFRFKLEVILKSCVRFLILPIFSDSIFQTYRHILWGIWDGLTRKQSPFYRKLVGSSANKVG